MANIFLCLKKVFLRSSVDLCVKIIVKLNTDYKCYHGMIDKKIS